MAFIYDGIASIASGTVNTVWAIPKIFAGSESEVTKIIIKEPNPLSGCAIVRLAGLSGALAVSVGAYGAHVLKDVSVDPERKYVFDTAYRMHMLHSVALMAVPLTQHPDLVGTLMITGMGLFCGSCYLHAFTGVTRWRWITPIGGTTLILAWLSMVW